MLLSELFISFFFFKGPESDKLKICSDRTERMCKPGDAGEVGDEPPQVVRSYSVVVAAGREGQDGAASSVSATCEHTQRTDGGVGPRGGEGIPLHLCGFLL